MDDVSMVKEENSLREIYGKNLSDSDVSKQRQCKQ